jgi:hypothetical protein
MSNKIKMKKKKMKHRDKPNSNPSDAVCSSQTMDWTTYMWSKASCVRQAWDTAVWDDQDRDSNSVAVAGAQKACCNEEQAISRRLGLQSRRPGEEGMTLEALLYLA